MASGTLRLVLALLVHAVLGVSITHAQSDREEQHILVSMRMIGHQILLYSGDSSSRILPIEKVNDRYRIQFESAFEFDPQELSSMIDRLVKETKIANSYIVEVERCNTEQVVYSYEIGDSMTPDLMPCASRSQPKACYVLFITLLSKYNPLTAIYHPVAEKSDLSKNKEALPLTTTTESARVESKEADSSPKKPMSYSMIALPIGSIFAFVGLFVYFRKRNPHRPNGNDPDTFTIGNSRFDRKNMTLSFGKETIELSSKESDLLFLLHSNENKTLEREYILKIVWGDEGDYIGRTLDVFISKLRKKLEADSRVKIINIRGIGYKLIVN
ncbi:winged helix-turn-helix domain-containing protein [Fluviicola taffensis]|uniref:winged helix-turn-helix domain-containing protein n=1 Tax=Fluviicola taffensis TaxID=191579 RepID=UPI0031379805